MEPGPPALGTQSLSHWTTRGVAAPELLEFEFSKCSQVMLMVLVWGPHFENHCSRHMHPPLFSFGWV